MSANNTKVKCCLTGCKHNSACCANPGRECYCTLQNISLIIDSETGIMDCQQYEYDYQKPYMCVDCQIEQNGEIDITPDPIFIIDLGDMDLDDLF